MAVQDLTEPDADDMADDDHGNRETQYELRELHRLPAELAALVERVDAEPGVDDARAVEQPGNRRELPELHVPVDAGRQRFHRNVAERVIEEMADQVGEQDDAAGEANLPRADAAYKGPDLLRRGNRHAIHIANCRDYSA